MFMVSLLFSHVLLDIPAMAEFALRVHLLILECRDQLLEIDELRYVSSATASRM